MGVEAVAAGAAAVSAGSSILGLAQSRKAGKRAAYEANEARKDADIAKAAAADEKKRLTDIQKQNQQKLDRQRKRLRGGLFGEEQEQGFTLG